MDILETITANKRREVARQKQAVPLDLMLSMSSQRLNTATVSMRRSLESSASGIIAEFKRRSPSKGRLHPGAKVENILPAYEQGGASACSVLTDSDFFGGSFGDLRKARSLVKLPLLRKDFIIDEYQLYQSRVLGADAVLLIAASLTEDDCRIFAQTAKQLDLETLLEIHSDDELSYMNEFIDMVGVNNRNLGTFHTDVENSFRLIERLKAEAADVLFVSESGISDTASIIRLREAGFRGFLIGETFMKTAAPGDALSDFISNLEGR
ncbi:MAG: indole-3-glycerol phosphate synthase TrpC [Tannerella sp.]|jgi:indole-3-glycerol phosphate synthase|nr:indole-3-glycerol phosphate synthase TrpC [Tannerella sp.]